MEVLFRLLDQQAAPDAWNLLRRLPPSPTLVLQLLTLSNSVEMLDKRSEYRLLYNLYLIEYLMDMAQNSCPLELLIDGAQDAPTTQQLQFYQ